MNPPPDEAPRPRASLLPPDERRAAIVAATIPLVRQHGYAVTTRQIADAAGVAEGTLFRVFDDKNELIREAICQVIEPTGLEERIAAIDPDLPLRARLIRATALMQQQLQDAFELMAAVRLTHPPGADNVAGRRPPAHDKAIDEIVALIDADRDAFRLAPAEVARLLRVLTFAGSHRGIAEGHIMTPDDIVSVLLDGVRAQKPHPLGDDSC